MGFDSAVRAIEAYVKIASEYVQIDVDIDPVAGRVIGAFILTLIFGHKLVEFFFRKGAGELYEEMSISSRGGVLGLFFFSSLILTPLFTYLNVAIGAATAGILLVAIPYYKGKKLRKEFEERAAKKKVSESILRQQPLLAIKQQSNIANKDGETVEKMEGMGNMDDEKIKEVKERIEGAVTGIKNAVKDGLRKIAKILFHKKGRANGQDKREETRNEKNKMGSAKAKKLCFLPNIMQIFERKRDAKIPKPRMKMEELQPDTKKSARNASGTSKIRRTTRVEEIKPEYIEVVQKEQKTKSKGSPRKKTVKRYESRPEIKTFRRVLDKIEAKYIKKAIPEDKPKQQEGQRATKKGDAKFEEISDINVKKTSQKRRGKKEELGAKGKIEFEDVLNKKNVEKVPRKQADENVKELPPKKDERIEREGKKESNGKKIIDKILNRIDMRNVKKPAPKIEKEGHGTNTGGGIESKDARDRTMKKSPPKRDEQVERKNKEVPDAKTDEVKYNTTMYNRVKTALKSIMLEREKAKLEKITWRDVRKIRKKVEEDVKSYHDRIVEEVLKLGDRASKTDVNNAAKRILGIEPVAKKTVEKRAETKKKTKKGGAEKDMKKKENKPEIEDDGLVALLGDEEDITTLLGDSEELDGSDDDLSKLLRG